MGAKCSGLCYTKQKTDVCEAKTAVNLMGGLIYNKSEFIKQI